jgi:hypothetical protein
LRQHVRAVLTSAVVPARDASKHVYLPPDRDGLKTFSAGASRKRACFFQDRATFKTILFDDIRKAQRTARTRGLPLAIRLNVLSDLPWERIFPDLFDAFPDVQFYDYTKVAGRQTPSNYHLTFSRSESNQAQAERELAAGRNVTVVFRDKVLPLQWFGKPVVSGDSSDLRFKDPSGHVIGLYAKGRALTDDSGFVVDAFGGCGAR